MIIDQARIEEMIRKDREEWDLLVAVLDAHPDLSLHDPSSPRWISRDVYAHLARWFNYSNRDMESYSAGRNLSPPIDNPEELNSNWQEADSWMTLSEARKRAHEAFEQRLRIIHSISLSKWDDELSKMARLDGAEHFALHRSYIKMES